jgi:hypothetical protein
LKRFATLLFYLFAITQSTIAQFTLRGKVQTKDGKPVPSASVFFSNTSIGTVADRDGQFVLYSLAAGRYELVVSSVGFETRVQQLNTEQWSETITITLAVKEDELPEVVVGSYTKETWEKWGKFFIENFLGTTPFSADCMIKNYGVIQFRNYTKRNELKAIANEPLIIENHALGYRIKYQLELFQYDFKTKIFHYAGYPLFEPYEKPGDKPKPRWERNRNTAYYGSKLHFMRSLFRNRLEEDGFEVRFMQRIPNAEKERVRKLNTVVSDKGNGTIVINMNGSLSTKMQGDSAAYYRAVLKQPDMLDIIAPAVLPGDSIGYGISESVAGFYFPDYLHITYILAKEDIAYLSNSLQSRTAGPQISTLQMVANRPMEVYADGSYFNPLDILSSGYWAWIERMGNMLPFNFKPTATAPTPKK